jgi:hypothetical protein
MTRTAGNPGLVGLATRRGHMYVLCFVCAFWLLVGALGIGISATHAPAAYAAPCMGIDWSPSSGTVGTMVTATGYGLKCDSQYVPVNPLTLYVRPGAIDGYGWQMCGDTSVQNVTVATVSYSSSTWGFTTTFAWPSAANTPGLWSICSKDANGHLETVWDNTPFTFSSPTAMPTPSSSATAIMPEPTNTPRPTATALPRVASTSTPGRLADTPTSTPTSSNAGLASRLDYQPPDSRVGLIGGGLGVLVVTGGLFLFWRKPWRSASEQATRGPELLPPPPDGSAGSSEP